MIMFREAVNEERAWDALSLATAVLVGIAVRRLLAIGWEQWMDREAPKNPAARSVDWSDALTWTIASGIAVGLSRLAARRGLAKGWKHVRGHYPHAMR